MFTHAHTDTYDYIYTHNYIYIYIYIYIHIFRWMEMVLLDSPRDADIASQSFITRNYIHGAHIDCICIFYLFPFYSYYLSFFV